MSRDLSPGTTKWESFDNWCLRSFQSLPSTARDTGPTTHRTKAQPEISPFVVLKTQSCDRRIGIAQRRLQRKAQGKFREDQRLDRATHGLHSWSMCRGNPSTTKATSGRVRCLQVRPLWMEPYTFSVPDLLALYPAPNFSTY